MSHVRQQAQIDAPPEAIWELLGDPNRHPEWWPRVAEVECPEAVAGCSYRQVTKTPRGDLETSIQISDLDQCRSLQIRCLDTGTFCFWRLTEAQGGTFVDVEFGMDPQRPADRIIDVVSGRLYFRRWLSRSVEALRVAAAGPE